VDSDAKIDLNGRLGSVGVIDPLSVSCISKLRIGGSAHGSIQYSGPLHFPASFKSSMFQVPHAPLLSSHTFSIPPISTSKRSHDIFERIDENNSSRPSASAAIKKLYETAACGVLDCDGYGFNNDGSKFIVRGSGMATICKHINKKENVSFRNSWDSFVRNMNYHGFKVSTKKLYFPTELISNKAHKFLSFFLEIESRRYCHYEA
jgi:hypothetical protein